MNHSYRTRAVNRILRRNILPALLAAAAVLVPTALAQSGVGMSPPRVEFQANAGDQLSQTIILDNPSAASALEVTATLNDAVIQVDGSTLYLPPGSHQGSLADWLAVSSLNFSLEPGETREVVYTVEVPPGTPEGTYWSILFFESQAPGAGEATAGIGIQTRVRVGHVIYVNVGQVTRSGEIEGFRYQPADVEPTSSIRVMFRNTGNALLRAEGRVELRNLDGELIHSLEVPSTPAFPGYASEIKALLPAELETGEYLVLAVLDYGQASVVTGEGWLEVP